MEIINRDSTVFYKSYYDVIRQLPPELQLQAYDTILQYAYNGTEPERDAIDPTVYIIYTMARPQIDTNNRRYKAAQKGGRPRKADKATEQPQRQAILADGSKVYY